MDILGFIRRRQGLFALLVILAAVGLPAWAATREYKLKAAFVYNFIKFVEWPSASGPIKVGILGKDPFDGELKKLESKKVGGRAIKVGSVKTAADAKNFDLVFVADEKQQKALISAVSGQPVLTVSDTPGFAKDGGSITLVSSRNRLRFQINQGTLKKANLKASSKLLGLATKIYDG